MFQASFGGGAFLDDLSVESVASQGHVGDPLLATVILPGFAQGLAQQRHVDADARFLHDYVWPDGGQQFILADELAGVCEQLKHQVEGARPQSHRLA